jgi:hypothetical protein
MHCIIPRVQVSAHGIWVSVSSSDTAWLTLNAGHSCGLHYALRR